MSNRALILFSIGFILVGISYAAFSRGNEANGIFSGSDPLIVGNLLASGYHKIDDRLHSFDIYEKGAHSVYIPVCLII